MKIILNVILAVGFAVGFGLVVSSPARAQFTPSVLLGDVWGQSGNGQHAKAEVMVLNSDGTFNMSGAMDYLPDGVRFNRMYHWTAYGTLTPGELPYEYSLYIHYDNRADLSCNGDAGDVFACQFGVLGPGSPHQENHDCFGDPAVKLVCVQERAYDPGQPQSPAEHTTWTVLQ